MGAMIGFAIVTTGLVGIAMDTICFIAVHFPTLLDDMPAAKSFDSYQHVTHGSRQIRGKTKLSSEC